MDAPDEMVEAVAQAAHDAECGEPETCTMTLEHYRDQARVVLSVPALAEVFARDAQVREIVQRWESDADVEFEHVLIDLTALYAPSPGVRVDSEER